MRILIRAGAVAAGILAATPAFAQWHDKAYTTRIETRPYYGATVTIEQGVRVFRGLPPTRHMIINPHGETPLNLSIEDTRIFEKSESHNHFHDHGADVAPHRGGVVGTPFVAGRKFRHAGKRFKKRPGRFGAHARRGPGKRVIGRSGRR